MPSDVTDVRVLVVADDPLVRAGLAMLLTNHPDCSVVGQVAGDEDLPGQLDIYRPDVILWDLGWGHLLASPPLQSPAAEEGPSISILDSLADLTETGALVIALLSDEMDAAKVWNAGARGLLLRDAGPNQLLSALLAVFQGLVIVDPTLTEALLPAATFDPPATLVEPLTPREQEVLQLLAEGLPNKVIAHRLDISDHTVKFHVNAIMSKLNAQSRTEAAVRATRLGLILL
jgi:DNA-binding NarL/FixJ family response regulator